MRKILFLVLTVFLASVSFSLHAKKIRNSLKIEKEGKWVNTHTSQGLEIILSDSLCSEIGKDYLKQLSNCGFSGYEKEISSNKETFILTNPSDFTIIGFNVRIDYLDMQDRMLHSRTISKTCEIPSHEARKFDIGSWDLQHSYFYHLGNEPKKVATPYKVTFTPLSFRISE